jgi:hypothetical protein
MGTPINEVIDAYKDFVFEVKNERSSNIKEFLQQYPLPKFLVFSDTIILYIDNNNINKINKTNNITSIVQSTDLSPYIKFMIYFLSDCIHNSILSLTRQINQLPIRASFIYDEYFGTEKLKVGTQGDNNPYTARAVLGKGAIRAYEWEEKQKWIGASFEPEKTFCNLKKEYDFILDDLLNKNIIVQYCVPTEDGFTNTYAINFVTEDNHAELRNALLHATERSPISDVKMKYSATIEFLDECYKKKCFRPKFRKLYT